MSGPSFYFAKPCENAFLETYVKSRVEEGMAIESNKNKLMGAPKEHAGKTNNRCFAPRQPIKMGTRSHFISWEMAALPLTDLLNYWQAQGKQTPATDFDRIYDELKRLAKSAISKEGPNHTLQPTELAAEAYLVMVRQKVKTWENRLQFFSVISLIMRRILVDHARRKKRLKRGDTKLRVTLMEDQVSAKGVDFDVLDIHRALEKLAKMDERHGLIAELKLFGGFTNEEVGEIMSLSSRTIKRDWKIIKGWMVHYLKTNPQMPTD